MTKPILALVAVSLLAFACGDDDTATPPASSVPATSTVAPDGGSGAADEPAAADPDGAVAGSSDGSGAETVETDGADDEPPETTVPPTTSAQLVPREVTPDTTPTTTQPATLGIPDPEDDVVNEGGVPITLDETAALACANAEFARDSINYDNLEQAERDVNAAADRAEPSEQPDIAGAADEIRSALDAQDPLAVVEGFLDICVEHGHQI